MATTTRRALSRGALALYAVAAVTAAATASSVFFLWARGAWAGLAIVAALPPSLLLGFIALASRFLCSALPLRSTSRMSIAIAHAGSAAAGSGLWVWTWKAWVPALNRQANAALTPDYSVLFGLGIILYLAAVAVHYLFLEIDALREAEEEVLRYRLLAREAAAGVQGAGRSAFSVQQPQRRRGAVRFPSAGGAGDGAAPGRFLPPDP